METLADIVRTVLVIIIVASLLELLLPESGLKPFVSFAMGLFVLIAILNPILNVAFKNRDFKVDLWDYKYNEKLEQQMLEKGLDINQQILQTNDDMIQEKLQGQISAIATLVPGVQEVDTQIKAVDAGALDKVYLVVRLEETEVSEQTNDVGVFSGSEKKLSEEEQDRIKEKILLVVDNMYGIEAGQIEIDFEGGS